MKKEFTLLKDGIVVDTVQGQIQHRDLIFDSTGKICTEEDIQHQADKVEVVELNGKFISHAFIDLHTHTRIPSDMPRTEPLENTYQAALSGGFTRLTAMANTRPVIDTPELVRQNLTIFGQAHPTVRISQLSALTIGLKGETLSPLEKIAEAGAAGFSDDGFWTANPRLMKEGMQRVHALGLKVFSHCEHPQLSPGGVIHNCRQADLWNLKIQGSLTESLAVLQDLKLAQEASAPLHICHVSTAESCRLIRQFKEQGVNVTAETAPHYFTLNSDQIVENSGRFKVNPPLRSEKDRQAIIQALRDGAIDAIATDHAPHPNAMKSGNFNQSAFGFIGLETALSLAITTLFARGEMGLYDIIRCFTTNPAKIAGITLPPITIGQNPDLTLFDPWAVWIPTEDHLRSNCKNSPFLNQKLTGKVTHVFSQGKLVYHDNPTANKGVIHAF